MKKIVILISGLVLLSVLMIPQQGMSSKKIPPVMYQFLSSLIDLSPYMYDEEAFISDKNGKKIQKSLTQMKSVSKDLTHHQRLTAPGYKKTAYHFIENIRKTDEAFSQGRKQYAFRLFRSTLYTCTNCHSQESAPNSMSWDLSEFKLPKETINKANFYYTVRGFNQAWELYADVVSTFKKHQNKDELNLALDRMLIIAMRVQRNPEKLLGFLEQTSKDNKLPQYFQEQNKRWIAELKKIQSNQGYKILEKKPEDFDRYVDRLYREVYPFPKPERSQKVVTEFATGLLFEFLNTRPQDKTQQMLFWLGASNLALDKYESSLLGEEFLQQCIEDYPATSVSHRCYHTLEDQWVIGFSGSSGIHLPMDLEKKLNEYRKKLNIDQPWLN